MRAVTRTLHRPSTISLDSRGLDYSRRRTKQVSRAAELNGGVQGSGKIHIGGIPERTGWSGSMGAFQTKLDELGIKHKHDTPDPLPSNGAEERALELLRRTPPLQAVPEIETQ